MTTSSTGDEQVRATVQQHYTQQALRVLHSSTETQATSATLSGSCCGSGCCSSSGTGDPITSGLYNQEELASLPLPTALASLGCGNPVALASLQQGEKVLDLGSGGGIDVLLSARRVGPTGFVYGLDMTDAMLELAERNRREAGTENVRFLKGAIEAIPLPDQSVNVILSNCVINLSADKSQVLREAYRVLTPGGRLAISDIVFQGAFPPALRKDLESWAGCIAGALEEGTYRTLLHEAGFTEIDIEVTHRYTLQDVVDSGAETSIASLSPEEQQSIAGKFVSAFIRARKPASA